MSAYTCHLMLIMSMIHYSNLQVLTEGNYVATASENEFHYIASVGLKRDNRNSVENHKCTGVLITKKLILTAAHCLKNETIDGIQVVLGSIDLMNGTKYDVDFRITYNQWANKTEPQKKMMANDIAIFKLLEDVDELVAVPAFLSSRTRKELFGQNAVITGWGVPNGKVKEASRYLQKANVKILSTLECVKIVNELKNNTIAASKRFLCTKADPYTLLSCGDSGGPLLANNFVIGINKGTCPNTDKLDFPEEFLKSHKVNLHTRVNYYMQFIQYAIQNY